MTAVVAREEVGAIGHTSSGFNWMAQVKNTTNHTDGMTVREIHESFLHTTFEHPSVERTTISLLRACDS